MTKEQAIERLKSKLDNDKEYLEQCNFLDLVNEVRLDNKSIEIVLSILKEKDKQIEQYQNILATNDMLHVIECENKYKIIDLMAEQLTTPIHDKEWIKKYYENKAKELLNK